MTEDQVEKCARAIYEIDPLIQFWDRPGGPPGNGVVPWDKLEEAYKERARKQFRAAITAYNPNERLPAPIDLAPEVPVFALEAAEELELRGRQAQGMLSAIPAIVADERLEQHNAIYESEAKRWFRLAAAVRAVIDAARDPNERLREAAKRTVRELRDHADNISPRNHNYPADMMLREAKRLDTALSHKEGSKHG